jgi:ribonuclease HII
LMLARVLQVSRIHEGLARAAGYEAVIGLDEAGVGTIAGPLVAAAVVLPDEWAGFAADSKRLSRQQRRAACECEPCPAVARLPCVGGADQRCLPPPAVDAICTAPGLVWACAVVQSREIDTLGAREAHTLAMVSASERVSARLGRERARDGGRAPRAITHLVDGDTVPAGLSGQAIAGGDGRETSIAAASIVASVVHECAMVSLSRRWCEWDLEINLGWPSRSHLDAIAACGPSGCHRASRFPFQRQSGRRMGYHPQRAAYKRVQGGLDAAAEALRATPEAIMDATWPRSPHSAPEDGQTARSGPATKRAARVEAREAAALIRHQRYCAFLRDTRVGDGA